MIKSTSYTKEWIYKLKEEKQKIDPGICEKMILALGLLEQLVLHKLDFVFKGGTSLILLIDDPQRFSIDIDVDTETSKNDIVQILDKISKSGLFKRYKEHTRKERGIPKNHFKFYFDSVINNKENFILLDVLYHNHSYPEIIQTPIKSFWIDTDENTVMVTTPTIDSILGDKMTAFAPNTTGVPYNINKSMEIVKQLFDVGRLFDLVNNFNIVTESFLAIVKEEIKFRGNKNSIDDVLNDIIETSLIIAELPKQETPQAKEILKGLKQFSIFPIGIRYRVEDSIISSSKASYLASKTLNKDLTPIERYSKDKKQEIYDFPSEYRILSKLRRRIPEAYFYWIKAIELSI